MSLDCEGKWGMADSIGPEHNFITHRALVDAYTAIIGSLDKRGLKATFAFVGAFTLTDAQRLSFLPRVKETLYRGKNWNRNFLADYNRGNLDGWFCPEALAMAVRSGHEIASHGFTHVPFDDPEMPLDCINAELSNATALAEIQGVRLETFVYPRNLVRHSNLLADHGLIAYRGNLTKTSRIMSLVREANICEKSQEHGAQEGRIFRIPAGHFFNWRHGARKLIPKAATARRWKSILDDACQTKGVAHLWLHPHNVISGPGTLGVLDQVLDLVAKMRDMGKIQVLTQRDYTKKTMSSAMQ